LFLLIIIIIIIIIIAFVCNKQTVITDNLHHRNRPKPPPPPRATSQTHRQHLIKQQIWQIEKKKKPKKKLGCGDRESTQTRDPPQAHATPPRRPTATRANPPKILENPLQTATVEIAKREGVCAHLASRFPLPSPPHSLTFVVAAQLASPRLRLHRLASVVTASPPSSPTRRTSQRHAALPSSSFKQNEK
jgi:hypothetical protein